MTKLFLYLLIIAFIFFGKEGFSQTGNSSKDRNSTQKASDDKLNLLFVSAGYNHSRFNYIDLGFRYYRVTKEWKNILKFEGASVGAEYNLSSKNKILMPYIGWQGQILLVAYGLRAEYAIGKEKQALGFSPELGLSFFEVFRITGGYRFSFDKNKTLGLSAFRFSLVFAIPIYEK